MTFPRSLPTLLVAALSLAGCVSAGVGSHPAPGTHIDGLNVGIDRGAHAAARASEASSYVLEPPDVIAVDVRGEPDLSTPAATIDPAGRVHRPLVGEVDVAGRTAAEVAADLSRRYARFIRDVEVAVSVVEFRSRFVYVTGEVRRPGRYPYTGNDTVLGALAQAGFLTRSADADAIHVARARRGYTERLPVRLEDVVEGGDDRTNWRLEQGDVVHVPPGFLARVAYAVQDVLAPVALPVRVHSAD